MATLDSRRCKVHTLGVRAVGSWLRVKCFDFGRLAPGEAAVLKWQGFRESLQGSQQKGRKVLGVSKSQRPVKCRALHGPYINGQVVRKQTCHYPSVERAFISALRDRIEGFPDFRLEYVHIYIYMYVCMCVHIYTYTHIHMYTCICRICTCNKVYAYLYLHRYTYTHIHTHVYTNITTHTYIYMYTYT